MGDDRRDQQGLDRIQFVPARHRDQQLVFDGGVSIDRFLDQRATLLVELGISERFLQPLVFRLERGDPIRQIRILALFLERSLLLPWFRGWSLPGT